MVLEIVQCFCFKEVLKIIQDFYFKEVSKTIQCFCFQTVSEIVQCFCFKVKQFRRLSNFFLFINQKAFVLDKGPLFEIPMLSFSL